MKNYLLAIAMLTVCLWASRTNAAWIMSRTNFEKAVIGQNSYAVISAVSVPPKVDHDGEWWWYYSQSYDDATKVPDDHAILVFQSGRVQSVTFYPSSR